MSESLKRVLKRATLGSPQTHENLTIFPLLDEVQEGVAYLALREAFEMDLVEVEEVSEGGSVPNLKIRNKAPQPVLLVDGEELKGAKQNRVVNTSLLIAAESEEVIPVSCTEQGRWSYTSRRFGDSGIMMNAKARYKKSMRIRANLMRKAAYDAEQGKVWEDVRNLHHTNFTHSSTGAMWDAFEQKEREMETYLQAFSVLPHQKGMIVFLNGHLFAIDYVSRHNAYAQLHDKWIKSHAIEAINMSKEAGHIVDMELEAHRFLQEVMKTEPVSTHKPVGLGEDHRFDNDAWGGASLVHDEIPVHLTAFNKRKLEDQDSTEHEARKEEESLETIRRRWARMHRFPFRQGSTGSNAKNLHKEQPEPASNTDRYIDAKKIREMV